MTKAHADSKQRRHLQDMGFEPAEIAQLAADRSPGGISAVECLMVRSPDMRRVLKEIRQADPEVYGRIVVVPL